jgi:hypothetical protein
LVDQICPFTRIYAFARTPIKGYVYGQFSKEISGFVE